MSSSLIDHDEQWKQQDMCASIHHHNVIRHDAMPRKCRNVCRFLNMQIPSESSTATPRDTYREGVGTGRSHEHQLLLIHLFGIQDRDDDGR
jgi:hypothetical protein